MGAQTNKRLVRSLMSRIRAYERFFKEKEKEQQEAKQKAKDTDREIGVYEPNNPAHSAYVGLIKLVNALDKESPDADAGLNEELTEERVREVLRDVYGI